MRFHEVSSRFAGFGFLQHLLTTSGGKVMQTALGCDLPMTIVPASLLLRREPYRLFRFWSYVVTSLLWRSRMRRIPCSDAIITVSDYFCDVIPALALKRRSGG